MSLDALAQAGYRVRTTTKSQYMRRLIAIAPKILPTFIDEGSIQLLSNAQLRKGKAYTIQQLLQIAGATEQAADFTRIIQQWETARLLTRGYKLTCSACTIEQFYPQHPDACSACHYPITLSDNADSAYQLIPLLQEFLKAGMLSVLLTALHFNMIGRDNWFAAIDIKKGQLHTDIDLYIAGRYIIECKDNFSIHKTGINDLKRQLSLTQQLANDIGVNCAFATLYPHELPNNLRNWLQTQQITLIDRETLLYR